MKVGIIGPSEVEIVDFIKAIKNVEIDKKAMLTFHSGNYEGIDVVAVYSGVCKVNAAIATQILIDKFDVTHIIVVGVAGGISKGVKILDTVISTEVAYHDVDKKILTEYHPWMSSEYFKGDEYLLEICKNIVTKENFSQNIIFGKIVTGEAFIDKDGRSEIINNYNPLCVDMETGSIAHVCYANRIPFIAIRSITDTEEESGTETFEINCAEAVKNSILILKRLIEAIAKR